MNLEETINVINKKCKANVCEFGLTFEKVNRIPFSSPNLNYMLYGGLPVGRIVEFMGSEGSAKTSSCIDICANAQKMFPDKKVLFVDVEQTFDPDWAKTLGLDVGNVLMYKPLEGTGAEEIFQACKDIVESGEISVCVIDSLGAMVSDMAYSKTLQDKTYGGISMALTNFSKQMIPICARTGCLLIGINQMRDDLNSMYGGTTTTGGKAWRHNSSVRLEFRRGQFIDEKGTVISNSCENPAGNLVEVRLVKSKICRSDRKINKFTIKYLTGIDYISDIIDLAIKDGKIVVAGAWYRFVDKQTGEILKDAQGNLLKFQGKGSVSEYLKNNPDIIKELTPEFN